FGPNGSGKTSLLLTIMGAPKYHVVSGKILFKGKDITSLPMDERVRLGIGIAFQNPPVIKGVKLRDMVNICARSGNCNAEELAKRLNLSAFLDRDINLGFSGGEAKRSELLQLAALQPDFIMLDEPDSGVDLVNITLVGEAINDVLERTNCTIRDTSGLIITHTGHILNYVNADHGHVMIDGTIRCSGKPDGLLKMIKERGYEECARCLR
ncbi:MAG: ABC transporter ATP-binding protein, partial [Methanocellales archaeon]|nr:ABC transporter ATP-binding protein [Methanocellales archaeon]